jgi:hypothetical protein
MMRTIPPAASLDSSYSTFTRWPFCAPQLNWTGAPRLLRTIVFNGSSIVNSV